MITKDRFLGLISPSHLENLDRLMRALPVKKESEVLPFYADGLKEAAMKGFEAGFRYLAFEYTMNARKFFHPEDLYEAIKIAVQNGHQGVVDSLFEMNLISKEAMLEFAVHQGDLEITSFMIEQGAIASSSILKFSIEQGATTMVSTLLHSNASLLNDNAAFITAVIHGRESVVNQFLGKDPGNLLDLPAAMMLAAESGHSGMMGLLMKSDPELLNHTVFTAIKVARLNQHQDVVDLLELALKQRDTLQQMPCKTSLVFAHTSTQNGQAQAASVSVGL